MAALDFRLCVHHTGEGCYLVGLWGTRKKEASEKHLCRLEATEAAPEMSAGWKAPDQGVCLSSLGALSCMLKEKPSECISLQFPLAA